MLVTINYDNNGAYYYHNFYRRGGLQDLFYIGYNCCVIKLCPTCWNRTSYHLITLPFDYFNL